MNIQGTNDLTKLVSTTMQQTQNTEDTAATEENLFDEPVTDTASQQNVNVDASALSNENFWNMITNIVVTVVTTVLSSMFGLNNNQNAEKTEPQPEQKAPAEPEKQIDTEIKEIKLEDIDTNNDGKLSPEEIEAAGLKAEENPLVEIDKNKDGKISLDEADAAGLRKYAEGRFDGIEDEAADPWDLLANTQKINMERQREIDAHKKDMLEKYPEGAEYIKEAGMLFAELMNYANYQDAQQEYLRLISKVTNFECDTLDELKEALEKAKQFRDKHIIFSKEHTQEDVERAYEREFPDGILLAG